ncbi:MAG: hypothetical protein LAN63_14160 [Acidobacteriia bacterium]|nr:hypothetical protein [Terriglobia bacterium]
MAEGDVYAPSTAAGPLRQCEVISDLRQLVPIPGAAWSNESPQAEIIRHPFAVVFSQDCDLTQDFTTRFSADPDHKLMLDSVLLCEAFSATAYRQEPKMGNIWKQLTQNNLERYHYLSKIKPAEDAIGEGADSLVLDFKRHFTVPTADIYEQLKLGTRRRSIIQCHYLEHLSTRFFQYQSRVAIPEPHRVKDGLGPL